MLLWTGLIVAFLGMPDLPLSHGQAGLPAAAFNTQPPASHRDLHDRPHGPPEVLPVNSAAKSMLVASHRAIPLRPNLTPQRAWDESQAAVSRHVQSFHYVIWLHSPRLDLQKAHRQGFTWLTCLFLPFLVLCLQICLCFLRVVHICSEY